MAGSFYMQPIYKDTQMEEWTWLKAKVCSLPGVMPGLPGDGLQPRNAAAPANPWCPSESPAPRCGSAVAFGTQTSHPGPSGLRRR